MRTHLLVMSVIKGLLHVPTAFLTIFHFNQLRESYLVVYSLSFGKIKLEIKFGRIFGKKSEV